MVLRSTRKFGISSPISTVSIYAGLDRGALRGGSIEDSIGGLDPGVLRGGSIEGLTGEVPPGGSKRINVHYNEATGGRYVAA